MASTVNPGETRDISRRAAPLISVAVVLFAGAATFAGPSSEVEPNNSLPGVAPSAGPLLVPGGTISGSITPGDVDYIRVTVPGIDPSGEGIENLSRRVFEVAANGDVMLDLIEPSTGRVVASSDDATGGVLGGGPGSARCVFDLLETASTPTDWTLSVRGFWHDAQFDYQVRYYVESVPPPQAISLDPFVPAFVIDSIGPSTSNWYALELGETGWLRVTLTPMGQFPADMAFALLDQNGDCIAFADDIFDARLEHWQSTDSLLTGTVFMVVGPATMRSALGTPTPEPGSPIPPLWDRRGVGIGEQLGWVLVSGSGGHFRVPNGSFRIDLEHGTPPLPCLADIDQNGGIDGGDLGAFFELFETGDAAADLDANGGIDGGDLATFFEHFEAGC